MQCEQDKLESNMKSKLQTSMAIFLLLISLGAVLAQERQVPPRPAPVAPAMTPSPPTFAYPAVPMIDPTTGLPIPQPVPEWKDPNWKDPDITLTNVSYDNLPISEIANDLREQFKHYFDILISAGWNDPDHPNRETMDPQQWQMKLQLRNVTASELFHAMNLVFETQNAPLRWELTMNGKRPMAVLRVIPELLAPAPPPPGFDPTTGLPITSPPVERKKPMVFFVGDLIGDEKSGGMTMSQIADTLSEINKMAYGGDLFIGFHKEAQVVIVRGTDEQIAFVQNMLQALKQKMGYTLDKNVGDHKKKNDEPQSSGGGPK
jgi:hypothetical protein